MHEKNFPLSHSLVSCEESSQFDFLELSPMRFLGFSWRFPQILLKFSLNNFCNDGGPYWMSHTCVEMHMCVWGPFNVNFCNFLENSSPLLFLVFFPSKNETFLVGLISSITYKQM
eukprot:TRINITY_DN8918_c1_g2_i1.p1 TRINITY_DN8918_c1_g2~~TRINITY_DN8918_c1_g2_i1.p1  ORF type:complete len:115 (+),score=15.94 TRINITY_DN8918_c1_g2_i1:670-1014(+)